MSLRWAIGAVMCLVWAGGFLLALPDAVRADTYLSARYGSTQLVVDLPDYLVPPSTLQNVVTLSTGAPVKPLLVPARVPDRWRFSVAMTGVLGYGAYRAGYKPIPFGGGDALTAIRQEGGAVLMSYQAPSGAFGAALRISATGAVRLVVDHVTLPRGGLRPGTGLVPKGIDYIHQPAPVPLPAPGAALLAAFAPLALLATRRRRS